jgi:AcrR family transcriptional regulator
VTEQAERHDRADGRRTRGEQTRRAILGRAADIASVEGLDGLTIGRLANELRASKSGVFAHFGSKEELQLATLAAATRTFTERVVAPALAEPPGLGRVWRLCEAWLDYAEQRVFPGGCFFFSAAAEFDARPGRVRDAVAAARRRWLDLHEATIAEAVDRGELAGVDPAQLAYELDALAMAANLGCLLHDDATAYARARTAILARLRAAAPDPSALPPG